MQVLPGCTRKSPAEIRLEKVALAIDRELTVFVGSELPGD
jgi:hypothetical protein